MIGNAVPFTDRNGERRIGKIVREYGAYEGGIRYIIQDETNGHDYRCVKVRQQFKELIL